MDERTKELLKQRPYLSKWFQEKPETQVPGNPLIHKNVDHLDLKLIDKLVNVTPSKIAIGRSGTRFKTSDTLLLREGHAIAKDAVYSEVGDQFIDSLNCIRLKSCNSDREDYLLNPNKGRRLGPESLLKLNNEGSRNVDLQIIIGDGLSAWAVERNVGDLLPVLTNELNAQGFSFGKILFVRFARVGIQDHIGVTLNARATIILVGERPGLGTGDSLSAYIAYNPKLNQDNSEKNCVSNIRPQGILPQDAALLIVSILKQAFSSGKGGVGAL